MNKIKSIKSIDLSSITIIGTGIQVLFAILFSLILLISVAIINVKSLGGIYTLALTIIFGTLAYSIFRIFTESYLYNLLVKKLNPIKITINDEKEITKISVASTSILVGTITLMIYIILYLMFIFIIPLIFSSMIQALMITGQIGVSLALYQLLILFMNPMTVVTFIILTFISTLVMTGIATYLYNIIASKTGGIIVELDKDNNMTVLKSINPLKIATIVGIISLIINLIIGVILAVLTKNCMVALTNPISGFLGSFIFVALFAIFYNFLGSKLGNLKVELVDE